MLSCPLSWRGQMISPRAFGRRKRDLGTERSEPKAMQLRLRRYPRALWTASLSDRDDQYARMLGRASIVRSTVHPPRAPWLHPTSRILAASLVLWGALEVGRQTSAESRSGLSL